MENSNYLFKRWSLEMKRKCSRLVKKRVLETKQCSRSGKTGTSIANDQATHIEDSLNRRDIRNLISGKRGKTKSNIKQRKLDPVCRKSRSSLDLEFSTRRKKSTMNRLKKRVMKATIISWLVAAGIVQENVEIFSIDEISKQMKNKGKIRREGILCLCCNKVFTVATFLVHGGRNCNKPYENVFVGQTKVSLLSCMIEAWNKPEESSYYKFNVVETEGNADDSYDDACMICADGGNLMCCEQCNSTYHQLCMGMEDVPPDSWYCPYCLCKFCAKPANENDYLVTCPQCEKRYHWECHQTIEQREIDLNSVPIPPFCERSCKEIYDKLEKHMVGRRNELNEGYSWTLLHQMYDDSGVYIEDKYLRAMCHAKLAVARKFMEECFEPIQDRYTRINVVSSVVYNCGANFRRINFTGFYTAILEKDDEIISTASLRIHGTKLAEMPFIATSEAYRNKGMCKKLMVAIESALRSLNVENLIIPSVPEKIGYWTERNGFCCLDVSMQKEIMHRNTVMFHDSLRLQKILLSSSHLATLQKDAKMGDIGSAS